MGFASVLLVSGCGGSHAPQPDSGEVETAKKAALIWFTAMWSGDFEASCPNMKSQNAGTPPFGGCGMAATDVSREMNPHGEKLISVEFAKFELKRSKAEFDSDHVTVNGRSLSEFVNRSGDSGHTRYIFKFARVQNLWYFQKVDFSATL